MAEKYEIDACGCFDYVGKMEHDAAVQHFNNLMEAGIWLDPDCALEAKDGWTLEQKCHMRGKMQKAFDEKHPIYGEIAFGIICVDSRTGYFGRDDEFIPAPQKKED